jgi:hypothetical protein
MVSGLRSTRVQELRRRIDRLPSDKQAQLVTAIPVLEELLSEE